MGGPGRASSRLPVERCDPVRAGGDALPSIVSTIRSSRNPRLPQLSARCSPIKKKSPQKHENPVQTNRKPFQCCSHTKNDHEIHKSLSAHSIVLLGGPWLGDSDSTAFQKTSFPRCSCTCQGGLRGDGVCVVVPAKRGWSQDTARQARRTCGRTWWGFLSWRLRSGPPVPGIDGGG